MSIHTTKDNNNKRLANIQSGTKSTLPPPRPVCVPVGCIASVAAVEQTAHESNLIGGDHIELMSYVIDLTAEYLGCQQDVVSVKMSPFTSYKKQVEEYCFHSSLNKKYS